MNVVITQAKVVGTYSVELTFVDGTRKRVNLEGWLYGEMFERLRDPLYFAQMRLEPGDITITWPNGADFAPEFLYELEPESVQPELSLEFQTR